MPGSGISARAGDFVELIEVQLLIVGLILLDVVASVFELLVMCGGGDTPTLVNTVVRILQARARSLSLSVERKSLGGGDSARAAKTRSPSQSFTGFSVFFFALEMATLLVAFGGAFFVQPGYVLDMVVVAVCLYSELFGEMKGASDARPCSFGPIVRDLTRLTAEMRLLGVLRLWRLFRINTTLVAGGQRALKKWPTGRDASLRTQRRRTRCARGDQGRA